MSSQATRGSGPTKQHHTPRYYAHRVHESLTTRVSKFLCTLFLALLLVVGVICFIVWLSLRPHRPRFHVRDFSMPALSQETGFENPEISFNVSDRNPNQHIGIYYDSMDGSVYHRDRRIGATPLLFPFYQEPKNTTWVFGQLSGDTLAINNNSWNNLMFDRAMGMVVFRLELTATIRFKKLGGSTVVAKVVVACDNCVSFQPHHCCQYLIAAPVEFANASGTMRKRTYV
ncbi:hypothetical protein HHK36_003219 [Tetracentron sinense]|uniref:Late embryogenesis abundant protein LEA-2 subgroup domain-containing protein n=1 Tax=Tetracentron sinense TaxID=13715 RepID=A0A835DP46_TETSI|nr:hypothetical protein HHK36_003219 [Tetracentron sinense]